MREITEREHKVKHHPLESPSHQKVNTEPRDPGVYFLDSVDVKGSLLFMLFSGVWICSAPNLSFSV